jgi:hypothetical protein
MQHNKVKLMTSRELRHAHLAVSRVPPGSQITEKVGAQKMAYKIDIL